MLVFLHIYDKSGKNMFSTIILYVVISEKNKAYFYCQYRCY